MNRDIIAFTKYKFNVYGKKDIRSGRDSAVVGIVGKSKSLDFPTMLIFWSLVRNSVVLAVYLLFSVACFLTVHEHSQRASHGASYASLPGEASYRAPPFFLQLSRAAEADFLGQEIRRGGGKAGGIQDRRQDRIQDKRECGAKKDGGRGQKLCFDRFL